MKTILIFLLTATSVYAECVKEQQFLGSHLLSNLNPEIYVEMNQGYHPLMEVKKLINPLKIYNTQLIERIKTDADFLTYYTPKRLKTYLNSIEGQLSKLGYKIISLGPSLKKQPLYAVLPKKIDYNKTTIVMFGRHHGDEGTANWIIEGFLNKAIKGNFFKNYQLLLYPMINPDGALAKSRYNSKGRDLNRVWDVNLRRSLDEVQKIHYHLDPLRAKLKKIPIVLDMHGSISKDFFYRVDTKFNGKEFYALQTEFIKTLKPLDPFQGGNFILSSGHPKMARIYLIREFNLNALTHETIKNIPVSSGRTLKDLKSQGHALLTTIESLY